MLSLQFFVSGNPIAKKRPRFARHGKYVRTYSDQETEEGKFLAQVLYEVGKQEPIPKGCPITMNLMFSMPRPKGHYGTGKNEGELKPSAPMEHTKKPDLDNMIKFVKDCLNGVLWHDDSQVVMVTAIKRYTEEQPGTFCKICWDDIVV